MKVKSFKMFDKNQKVFFFVRLFLLFSQAFISPYLLIQPVTTICQIRKLKQPIRTDNIIDGTLMVGARTSRDSRIDDDQCRSQCDKGCGTQNHGAGVSLAWSGVLDYIGGKVVSSVEKNRDIMALAFIICSLCSINQPAYFLCLMPLSSETWALRPGLFILNWYLKLLFPHWRKRKAHHSGTNLWHYLVRE